MRAQIETVAFVLGIMVCLVLLVGGVGLWLVARIDRYTPGKLVVVDLGPRTIYRIRYEAGDPVLVSGWPGRVVEVHANDTMTVQLQ